MTDQPAYAYLDPLASDASTGILGRLRRRKMTVATVFTSTILLCWGAVSTVAPRYAATASVFVDNHDPTVGQAVPALIQKIGDPADIETQTLVMRSPRLIRRVLENPEVTKALISECELERASAWWRNGLPGKWGAAANDCAAAMADTAAVLEHVDDRFSTGVVGRSRAIALTYRSLSPQTAAIVANALVDAYLADQQATRVGPRAAATQWLRTEIDKLRDNLDKSELAIEDYRRDHGLLHGQIAPLSAERLSGLTTQLAQAEAERASAASRLQQIQGAQRTNKSLAETPEILGSRTIQDLKIREAAVDAQLAQITQKFGPRHPEVISLEGERVEIAKKIDREMGRIGASLQQEVAAAAARVADLTSQLNGMKHEASRANGAEALLQGKLRDAEIDRELYVALTKKANELETEARVLTPDASLLSYAEVPSKPWFPKVLPFMAAATALALAFAAAAALLRDHMDRTIRTGEDLETGTGVRVLAYVPELTRRLRLRRPRLKEKAISLGGNDEDTSGLEESMRALFAQVVLMSSAEPVKSILVTSSEPGEGKTFLTLALAQFAASTGRRVLAIEADLRRPSFLSAGEYRTGPGLTEFLRGVADFGHVVRRSNCKNLDVIGAGAIATASTELLSNGRLKDLMAAASGQYDVVILDSPPNLLLMDARIIARHVDRVVYCARWGRSRTEAVASGYKAVSEAGGRLSGLAIGMVRHREYGLYETRRPAALKAYVAERPEVLHEWAR